MKRATAVLYVLACVATQSHAQLTIATSRLDDGATEIRLTNASPQSVAAFAITARPVAPQDGRRFLTYQDPAIDDSATQILPGGERTLPPIVIFCGPDVKRSHTEIVKDIERTRTDRQYRRQRMCRLDEPVFAAVFADGSSTGDPVLLHGLKLRRSNMLLAIDTSIETLSRAGRRNVPREQLITDFKNLADALNRWYLPEEQRVGGRIYQAIVAKLIKLPSPQLGHAFPPSDFVQRETARFRGSGSRSRNRRRGSNSLSPEIRPRHETRFDRWFAPALRPQHDADGIITEERDRDGVMPQTFTAKPFFQPRDEPLRYLPEGPRVLQNLPGRTGNFLGWVGIQHGADATNGSINVLNLGTGENFTHDLPGRPGFFAETTTPGLVLIGLERRLVVYDLTTHTLHSTGFAVPENDRVIINDGLPIEGGVLFGTKHLDFKEPVAALYHYDIGSETLTELIPEQTCSNGKMLIREPEGYTLIDIDSAPKTISRYRLDTKLRTVISRSLVVAPETLPAVPDGLRPTPDGNIVVAFYNPEAVSDGLAWHLDIETGDVKSIWTIPGSPRVTCPEFVRLNGEVKILFTTATEGMPEEVRAKAANAGTMFIADTPFTAMPAPPPLLDL